MRKVNNKGFAISTLIYGLSIIGILLITIIMTEMATIRSNSKQITKSIEQDLNSFSKTSVLFKGKEDENNLPVAQKFVVPNGQAGWYKIELWGSSVGAYTSGIIKLEDGEVLYFYVGKNGCRETDVRIKNGAYDDIKSYQTRIMIASSSGVVGSSFGGALYGGNSSMTPVGGYIDSNGTLLATGGDNPTNGSLIGYKSSYSLSTVTQSGLKTPLATGGGGDGYEPSSMPFTGGSSFISGYLGSKAIIAGTMTDQATYKYKEYSYNESTNTYDYVGPETAYYFIDGIMIPGVKGQNTVPQAKIEKVADADGDKTLTRKNAKLNTVSKITDCYENVVENKDWVVKAIADGEELAGTGTTNGNCYEYTLTGGPKKVDEIAIWHPSIIGQNIINHTIKINDSVNIKQKGLNHIELSETEKETGTRISAYQYDALDKLPSGKYYIMPVLSERKVLTAPDPSETDSNAPVKISGLIGELNQKWAIELIDSNTNDYKITELSKFKSLTINGTNQVGRNLKAENFNAQNTAYKEERQIWQIEPVGDGTYFIKTKQNGNRLIAQTNQSSSEVDYLKIVPNNTGTEKTARFKFIPLEYSSS